MPFAKVYWNKINVVYDSNYNLIIFHSVESYVQLFFAVYINLCRNSNPCKLMNTNEPL